mmetsp:Transcript_58287/g.161153  ORF Transcript_58287/g.161153 Transcript_58287/m.161153 type:complete len:311 (-) Transcript_58287:468-1400(-)|eukprot:CAMPEP_0179117600 /NCGR_PEP_ID=MMETSP0796-20121207/55247_1 /TAXON_ID=73915 /ORGANISM="Pyrodinium bahamense, Strain pbaha01" /LENGTH=310 /DNA_ID=CAMNT_0020815983 /DNA_START=24 /DNA_END=956 /DNA_ORIENTATION=+
MVGTSSDSASTGPTKTAMVGLACAADLAVNYPLWVVAKRLGAGLSMPRGREFYKGAFCVWLSYFPTVACDEAIGSRFAATVGAVMPGLGSEGRELAAAATAGALSGLLVAAPTENLVTRAHSSGASVAQAFRNVLRTDGIRRMAMPFGMTAMMGREVPFSMGIFCLRDHFARLCHDYSNHHSGSVATDTSSLRRSGSSLQWWAEELGSSMACAAVVNLPAHPASVVLAQQQAHCLRLGEAVWQIYASGGLRGFYVGFMSRAVSIGGAMFVVPTVLSLGSYRYGIWESMLGGLRDCEAALNQVHGGQLQRC